MLSRWSFTRFVILVPIENSKWPPWPIMCSDWSKFQISSFRKLQCGLNWYFVEMIIRWSCTVLVNRLPIGNSKWPPWRNIVNIGPYGNFTFQSSSLKPLNRFQPNLAEMLSRWSFTRFVKLVPIENSKWPPGPIMCSDWSKFQKSSCQKLQCGLNWYFAEMIVRWSCTQLVNRLPIGNSKWPPWRN